MNFKDPVTTFAYNLISLHHDIMWYIIIILTLVYWSLYKILKEYSWNTFNKQEGFLLYFLNSIPILKVQKFIFYLWATFFIYNILYIILSIYLGLAKKLDYFFTRKNKNMFYVKLYSFLLGKSYFVRLNKNYTAHLKNFNLKNFDVLILERFFSYYLFNKTSNAIFFYEGTDSVLSNLQFKHSINLEYVFGLFPTVIIGFIIVPSMYLLYSNETDINPCITIKVIGHQWYWSYESNSANFIKKTKEVIYLNYNFESIIVNETDLIKGRRRLLETDTSLVIPYNVVLRFLIHLRMFYIHEQYQKWV